MKEVQTKLRLFKYDQKYFEDAINKLTASSYIECIQNEGDTKYQYIT